MTSSFCEGWSRPSKEFLRHNLLPTAVALVALSGCMGTGSTITVPLSGPQQILIEYTRYGGEFEAAADLARRHCAEFGRYAQFIDQRPAPANPYDRLLATFNCVAPA